MNIYALRVVWTYFNGSIPKKLEINHKNCITDDNRLSNLEIVTKGENKIHAYKNGLIDACGENNGRHKLRVKDILKIRKLLKEGIAQDKISEMYNVSRGAIGAINTKRNWAWLS